MFDGTNATRGVYFFDEFDAIGAHWAALNDVGEIWRVLNSFLQFLEQDQSQGLIVAATNHPELLDPALFGRFDDELPDAALIERSLKARLAQFSTDEVDWPSVVASAGGLSHADLVRAADEAAKAATLDDLGRVTTARLLDALGERKRSTLRSHRTTG